MITLNVYDAWIVYDESPDSQQRKQTISAREKTFGGLLASTKADRPACLQRSAASVDPMGGDKESCGSPHGRIQGLKAKSQATDDQAQFLIPFYPLSACISRLKKLSVDCARFWTVIISFVFVSSRRPRRHPFLARQLYKGQTLTKATGAHNISCSE